jgi:hypothetical protein
MARPLTATRLSQRRSTQVWAVRVLSAIVALLTFPAVPGPAHAATDPLRLAARAPTDLDALVIVRSGADLMDLLRRSPAGRELAGRLLTEQTQRSWRALSARLGWSERETADRLFGGLCLLGVYNAGEQEPGWAFVAEVSAETSARLRANLDAFPRQVIAGHPVLSIEDGAYVLVLRPPGRGADPHRSHRLLIAPTAGGGERRLASLVGMLSGEGPAPFARTQAFRRLRDADPALFMLIMREPAPPGQAPAPAAPGDWSAFMLLGLAQVPGDGGQARLAVEFVRSSPALAETLRALPTLPDALPAALPATAVAASVETSTPPARSAAVFAGTGLLTLLPLPWDDAAEAGRDRPLLRVVMLREAEPGPDGTPGAPPSPSTPAEAPPRFRLDLAELYAPHPGQPDARRPGDERPPALAGPPDPPDAMDARIAALVGQDLGVLSRFDPHVTRSLEVRDREGDLFALTGRPVHVSWRAARIGGPAHRGDRPPGPPPEECGAPDQVKPQAPPTPTPTPTDDHRAWWWSCSMVPDAPRRDPGAPPRGTATTREREWAAFADVPLTAEPARRWIAHGWVRPAQAPAPIRQRLGAVPLLAPLTAEAERYAWSIWAEADGRLEARFGVDLRRAAGDAPAPPSR